MKHVVGFALVSCSVVTLFDVTSGRAHIQRLTTDQKPDNKPKQAQNRTKDLNDKDLDESIGHGLATSQTWLILKYTLTDWDPTHRREQLHCR